MVGKSPRSFALIGSLILGLYGALSVSYSTITGSAPCPFISGLPICFIVAAGYATMLFSSVVKAFPAARRMFFAGWVPVFILASVGTALEVLNGNTCPKTDGGIPFCYLSLGLVIAVVALFVSGRKGNTSAQGAELSGP